MPIDNLVYPRHVSTSSGALLVAGAESLNLYAAECGVRVHVNKKAMVLPSSVHASIGCNMTERDSALWDVEQEGSYLKIDASYERLNTFASNFSQLNIQGTLHIVFSADNKAMDLFLCATVPLPVASFDPAAPNITITAKSLDGRGQVFDAWLLSSFAPIVAQQCNLLLTGVVSLRKGHSLALQLTVSGRNIVERFLTQGSVSLQFLRHRDNDTIPASPTRP